MTTCRASLMGVLMFLMGGGAAVSKPVALRMASSVVCAPGTSKKFGMRPTDRLPEASGSVIVECKGGATEIDIEIDSMKPASLFGGDYNTYVLWVAPPIGPAENLGEITLDGDHGSAHGSTTALRFAVLVTAEPHYLVSAPSAFVILDNKPIAHSRGFWYPVVQGVYNFERTTLDDTKEASGRVHTEVRQAFTAVRLAQRSDAANMAKAELAKAERALDETLQLSHERAAWPRIAAQARETVRLAVAAQRLANDRAFQGARAETEGLGGGGGESERRDQRGLQ
jgi:hypothetical protein